MGPFKVVGKLSGDAAGELHLKHGMHKVFVKTCCLMSRLVLEMSEGAIDGCGNVPTNMVGYQIRMEGLNPGVEFHANVQSDKCKIEWVAFAE